MSVGNDLGEFEAKVLELTSTRITSILEELNSGPSDPLDSVNVVKANDVTQVQAVLALAINSMKILQTHGVLYENLSNEVSVVNRDLRTRISSLESDVRSLRARIRVSAFSCESRLLMTLVGCRIQWTRLCQLLLI